MAVQTATIVVTDVVGSTALRVALGEERAEQVRRGHDRILSDAATANGGTVVKGLGDGLLVTFAGSAEALAAAVSMQQVVNLSARDEGLDLAMRVGVSAGDVTLEGGDCFGTPVVEASRLCAAADGGQILVADLVRLLARGRGGLEFDVVGALDLKGLPESVETWSLRWSPVRGVADLRAEPPYVGRAVERAVLSDCWGAARIGPGGLVLVAGEPGIGKTRMVKEWCADVVERDDAIVVWGGCHEGDALPHGPFVEALTGWLRSVPVDDATEVLDPDASVLARILPAIREIVPDVAPAPDLAADEATARLHDAVGQVLDRLARRSPVVLVLDDLHWADDETIGMLRAVARRARTTRLLVIGTYRETDLDRRHPLAQALPVLRREVEYTRVALDGLEPADVQVLLERLAGHEVNDEFAQRLARDTDGNPFFLRETLLHLVDAGRVRMEDGVWTADGSGDLALPEGVREVVGRRLSQLSDDANALLGIAALFESGFPLPVVAEVAGLGDVAALDALDDALRARIVRATDTFDQYAFTHALFRQTLVAELNPSRQVRAHRAIAEALEKRVAGEPTPAQARALLTHFERSAALPGSERATAYAVVVADDAASRYAYRQEYDALVAARELDPDWALVAGNARRVFATAACALDDVALLVREAEAAAARIADEEGPDAAVDAVVSVLEENSWALDREARERIAAVARRHLRRDRRDGAWVWIRTVELETRDLDGAEAGIIADDPEWRAVHDAWVAESLATGVVANARSLSWLSESEAEQLAGGPASASLSSVGTVLLAGGDYRGLAAWMRVMLPELRSRGVVGTLAINLVGVSRAERVIGDHDGADAALTEASSLLPRIDPSSNTTFQVGALPAMRALVCGESDRVFGMDTLMPFVESPDSRWYGVAILAALASAHADNGDPDQAIAVLERCLPGLERAPGWTINYPFIAHVLAGTLFVTGRADHVDVIERNIREKILDPYYGYLEAEGHWSLARVLAVSGRIDEARAEFATSRRRLGREGRAALLVGLDHDEILMEVRLGTNRDVARIAELLASARAGCAHPAMAPWLPRLADLERRSVA